MRDGDGRAGDGGDVGEGGDNDTELILHLFVQKRKVD